MNYIFKIIATLVMVVAIASAAVDVDALRKLFLTQTNNYRVLHQVGKVVVNSTIQAGAQEWADYLAFTYKGLKHSSSGFGENLAYASSSIANTAVKMWYDEVKYYNFSAPGFSSATGHFTQLVWKNSKQVGFGITESKGIVYVVCRYSPPGNYLGQFDKNVFPASS